MTFRQKINLIGVPLPFIGVIVLLWHHGVGPLQLGLLVFMSAQGPVITWVAEHRMHHAFTDREGDPHSPHRGNGGSWWGTDPRTAATRKNTLARSSSTPPHSSVPS